MTTIQNNFIKPVDAKELFASFEQKKNRYRITEQNKPVEATTIEVPGVIDKYVTIVKNNPKKFTIAGVLTALIGGASILFGKKYSVIKANVFNSLQYIRETANSEASKQGKKKLEQVAAGIFNLDVMKNMGGLIIVRKTGSIADGIVNHIKNLIGNSEKECQFFRNLSEKIINGSKKSLEGAGTSGTARENNRLWKEKVANLGGKIKTELSMNSLTPKEKELADKVQEILDKHNLARLARKVEEGFESRTEIIRDKALNDNIKPYLEKYLPQNLSLLHPIKSCREIKRAFGKLKEGFFDKELVREKWKKSLGELDEIIDASGGGNIPQILDELDDIYKQMNKVENPSKAFKEIKKMLHDNSTVKSASGYISGNTVKGKGVINGYKELKYFEKEHYAGRVIDLEAGGGIAEILIPPVVGTALTVNIVKDSEPGTRVDSFMKKGGVAFVGGLFAWAIMSARYGINGFRGIMAGALSGIALDTIGKIIYKFVKKGDKKPKEQPPEQKSNINPRVEKATKDILNGKYQPVQTTPAPKPAVTVQQVAQPVPQNSPKQPAPQKIVPQT